jgi:hypothetical protein
MKRGIPFLLGLLALSACGAGGTGGTTATGGVIGTGGVVGTGGALGSGGAPGTGGTSSSACNPACTAHQDCVGGSCVPQFGGTCSFKADCPASATCCSGGDQCDGTRLPAGDGTNSGRFVVNSGGWTVTDTITGLVWQRDGSGTREHCGNVTTCTWDRAQAYCDALVLISASDWRLPTRMELLTIVDFTLTSPSIDPTAFPDTAAERFWTSSPYAGSPGDKWSVNFYGGNSFNYGVDNYFRVRCVY